jgi:hypothetical protein
VIAALETSGMIGIRPMVVAVTLGGCAPPLDCGQLPVVPSSAGAADFLYADGALPTFTFEVEAESVAALPDVAQGEGAGVDVPATLGFEGETWEVGLRLKGHSSFRPFEDKAAFKIDVHQYHRDARFFGLKRLTFNNMEGDASMLAEELAYRLYEEAGLVSPRHGYACLQVNGEDYGLYGLLDSLDELFLERNFEDASGWLYEGKLGADLVASGATRFDVQETGEGEAWADLVALSQELLDTPDDLLVDWLDLRFGPTVFDAWAAEVATANADGYLGRDNNFWLYHEPGVERWTFLPWGTDETWIYDFDAHDPEPPEGSPHKGALFQRCMTVPACVERYDTALLRAADRMDEMALVEAARTLVEQLLVVSREDPKSPPSGWDVMWAQDRVIHEIDIQPDTLRRQLAE